MNWHINIRKIKRFLALALSLAMIINIVPNEMLVSLASTGEVKYEEVISQTVSDNSSEQKAVNYNAGSGSEKKKQTLSWSNLQNRTVYWKEGTYTNEVIGAQGDVTYDASCTYNGNKDDSVATVDSETGVVTMHKAGTVSIRATAAETDIYEEESITYTLEIAKSNQVDFKLGNELTVKAGTTVSNPVKYNAPMTAYWVSNDNIDVTNVGTGTFEAIKSSADYFDVTVYVDENQYYESGQYTYQLKVDRNDRTPALTFEDTSATITVEYGKNNNKFTNKATGMAGSSITYTSTVPNVATVGSDGVVQIKKPGETIIKATIVENEVYNKEEVSYKLVVNKGKQEVTFSQKITDNKLTFGKTGTVKATAKGKGTIVYSSTNENVLKVGDNGEVSTVGVGTAKIKASVEATEYYEAASATYEVTVEKANQSPKFNKSSITMKFNENGNVVNNFASGGHGTLTYSITAGSDIAIINATTGAVTVKGAGTIKVSATFAGNGNYNSATITYTITVDKSAQTIKFPQSSYSLESGTDFSKTPVATESDANHGTGAITYKVLSDEKGVITSINKSTGEVTFSGKAGEATIQATKAADANYAEAIAKYVVKVYQANQTVTFEKANPGAIDCDTEFTNKAIAKSKVSYTSSDSRVATVDGNGKLTIYKAGTVTITATAEKDDYYNSSSASYTIEIKKADQQITFADGKNVTVTFNDNQNIYKNVATSNKGVTSCSYKLSGDNYWKYAEIDNQGQLKIKGAGTVTVTVTFNETDKYNRKEASYTLNIEKDDQAIGFKSTYYSVKSGKGFITTPKAEVTSTNSGTGAIVYEVFSDDSGVITRIDSKTGEVTFSGKTGKAVVLATKKEDANYEKATAKYTVEVLHAEQEVKFEKGTDAKSFYCYEGQGFENKAYVTGTNFGGSKITYTSSDDSIAKVDENGKITVIKDGTVIITATAGKNIYYQQASASYEITFKKADQHITLEKGNKVNITYNDNGNVFINKATSKNAVGEKLEIDCTYTLVDEENMKEIAEVVDAKTGEMKIHKAGEVEIEVAFEETNWYLANTQKFTLTIAHDDQKIKFPETSYKLYCGIDFEMDPVATESSDNYGDGMITYSYTENPNTEGLKVVKSFDPATGAIEFTYFAGTVTVTATKAGDERYNETTAKYTVSVVAWIPDEAPYVLEGNTKTNNGWFTGDVTIKAKDGHQISYKKENGKAEWAAVLPDKVTTDSANNKVTFYVKAPDGKISKEYNIIVKKDIAAPEAAISVTGDAAELISDWSSALTIIGKDQFKNGMTLKIDYSDETSKVSSVQYYIDDSSMEIKDEQTLIGLSDEYWTNYNDGQDIIKRSKSFVIYAKVMDTAGNCTYVHSNPIVYENNLPEMEVTPTMKAGNNANYFKDDVYIDVTIGEKGSYSGIQKIWYKIVKVSMKGNVREEEVTKEDVLYEFEVDAPGYSDLLKDWTTKNDNTEKRIKVDAKENDADEVYVYVYALDNAGNLGESICNLSICTTEPSVEIVYLDEPEIQNEIGEVKYYNETRKAQIRITGRSKLFVPNNLEITIKAVDVNGNPVEGETFTIAGFKEDDSVRDKKWDDSVQTREIEFFGDVKYSYEVKYKDAMGNAKALESDIFVVDKNAPTGSVTLDGDHTWASSDAPKIITFECVSQEKVIVSTEVKDITSPIKTLEYFVSDSTDMVPVEVAEDKWILYNQTEETASAIWNVEKLLEIGEDNTYFTVYLKVTDYANNVTYYRSNGFVVDANASKITISADKANTKGYYNKDIVVKAFVDEVDASDNKTPYSGISTVKYWVTCDGKQTQSGTLFDYKNDAPTYAHENLVKNWSTNLKNNHIVIDSKLNNSDNVKLYIETTDNAGNTKKEVYSYKIDITAPKMELDYNIKSGNHVEALNRGFYNKNRTATITITERTSTFDGEVALNTILSAISACDSSGQNLTISWDKSKMVWKHTEGETPDDAKHSINILFSTDANYTIDAIKIMYTDNSDNRATELKVADGVKNPFSFTVDKKVPEVTVQLEGGKWNSLLNAITFNAGNKEVKARIASKYDATSRFDIYYYVTNKVTPVGTEELKKLTDKDWTLYTKPVVMTLNKYCVVYFKAVDYAGNTVYLNADGYIWEDQKSNITITPEKTDIEHNGVGVYNKDVEVLVEVSEPTDYSGISTVEYWVTCDNKETQRETLFDYTKDGPALAEGTYPQKSQLKHSFSKKIQVLSELNNSCNVVVYVKVQDRAGNVSQSSLKLDIDITAPAIQITYNNNDLKKEAAGREYYDKNRTATVVITERTGHFEPELATEGIDITTNDIKDFKDTDIISGWTTTESKNGADAATHTAKITYAKDANYTFEMSYTDKAGNSNVKSDDVKGTKAPYKFTVDKNAPTGTLEVSNMGEWDDLIGKLTFELTTNVKVKVSGTVADKTSPIDKILYYKTSKERALTVAELEKVTDWTSFTEFYVNPIDQFTIYKKVIDYAGNVTYISTNGVILDDRSSQIMISTPHTDTGFYNSDVSVGIQVIDPKEASSGIKEITYSVYNMGAKTQEGVLFKFDNEKPTYEDIVTDVSSKIIVDSMSNNSNSVTITVNAIDNAGNTSTESKTIMIDITKPTISVSYDNNNGDTSFGEPTYFKENRTATITVVERNFNPGLVNLVITNSDGVIPTLSAWSSSNAGAGNGDGTTHTAYVVFAADGDYTLDVSCSDVVGNTNTDVNYSNSLAPQSFTVDKTLPVIEVSYDNNSAENGSYYKEERVATIRIREHNFETSRIQTEVKATEDGAAIQAPTISGWSSAGDVHTATIRYTENALYKFNISYIDKAGNTAATFAEQSFYVDKTAPEISISGIVNESANNATGNIGFVITATDVNFDQFVPVVEVTYMDGETIKTKQVTDEVGSFTDVENGKVYTVTNLSADGIYTIKCTVVDKAGNAFTEVSLQDKNGSMSKKEASGEDELVLFSVNRNGSTYDLSDATKELINNYYVKILKNDLVIEEVNSDELKEYSITLNGNTLTEGKDYTVSVEGSRGQWMKYTYTIRKDLFDKEGEYRVVVSSKDKAGNNAYNDVKGANINFVVDRTAPVVTVTGLSKNGRYQVEKQTVTIMPSDDGGALKSVLVQLVDDDGKSVRELINLSGADLEKALTDGAGKLSFEIEEGLYQNVEILCEDYAIGDAGSNANAYAEVFSNVSVSTSKIKIWWANKTLRYGVMGGFGALVAAIFFIILFKRRKDQEETN